MAEREERKIEQVHFQLTRNCNLRCYFCGQWGRKGFFSDSSGTEMQLTDWEKVILELNEYREKTQVSPYIMLWGGEPLVAGCFEAVTKRLWENNYKIGMVTNGVFLKKYGGLVDEAIERIYVSLDGPPAIHDRIRGKGVFEKVIANLKELKRTHITVMTVITEELLTGTYLEEFLKLLKDVGIEELYLQDMIGLREEEIVQYQKMMKETFQIDAQYINGWKQEGKISFGEQVDSFLERIDTCQYPFRIEHKAHGRSDNPYCLSPFRHVHITWNGNVCYCTDFYDFSAGNVREQSLTDIFRNEKSESFRQVVMAGNCPTCEHCSWKGNKEYQ